MSMPSPLHFPLFRAYRWLRRSVLPERLFGNATARTIDRALARRLRPDSVRAGDVRLEIDPHDHLDLTGTGVHEEFTTKLLLRELQPGDTALDLGAHIGYFTLHFARRVGPEGRVYAFEPHPDSFRILTRNVENHDLDQVVREEKAVLEGSCLRRMFGGDARSADHRLFARNPHEPSIRVECVSLDEYFGPSPPPVDLVKMDLQGAEGRALKGMKNCLDTWSSLALLLEYWPYGLRRSDSDPGEVLRGLESRGFQLYTVERGQATARPTSTLAPMKAGAIQRRYDPDPGVYTNLLALKGRKLPALWRRG